MTGEVNKRGDYATQYGRISESFYEYRLHNLGLDLNGQKKFTQDFMDSMGFKYVEKEAGIKFLTNLTIHHYSNEFSKINFGFYETFGDLLKISFIGWTNDPELVVFPLSEELALEKALSLTNYLYSSGECGLWTHQSEYIRKTINDGFPIYEINLGACHGEYIQGGTLSCDVRIRINAMNLTDFSHGVYCSDG